MACATRRMGVRGARPPVDGFAAVEDAGTGNCVGGDAGCVSTTNQSLMRTFSTLAEWCDCTCFIGIGIGTGVVILDTAWS